MKATKSILLLALIALMAAACSNQGGTNRKDGKCRVVRECLSAIDESSYSELLKVCNRKDETQLMRMITEGRVYVVEPSENFVAVDHEFGKVKIRGIIDGVEHEVWVASESVEE